MFTKRKEKRKLEALQKEQEETVEQQKTIEEEKQRLAAEKKKIEEEKERLLHLNNNELMVELIFAVRGLYTKLDSLENEQKEIEEAISYLLEQSEYLESEIDRLDGDIIVYSD